MTSTNSQSDRTFATIASVAQFFYGGWFLFHGLNYWCAFYIDPTIRPGPGLIPALVESGVMTVVKSLEITIGVMLLLDLFSALAIVAAWPITLMIAYVTSSHLSAFGMTVGIIIIALNAIMSFGHLDRYRAMLAFSAGRPTLNGLLGGRKIEGLRRSIVVQVLLAALGVAAAAGVTFLSLMR